MTPSRAAHKSKPPQSISWLGFHWHCNGEKCAQGEYRDGKQHGHWIYWWPNGKKAQEGEYRDGSKRGRWMYWEDDGNEIGFVEHQENKPA